MPEDFFFNKEAAFKASNDYADQGWFKVHVMNCSGTKDKLIQYQVVTQARARAFQQSYL